MNVISSKPQLIEWNVNYLVCVLLQKIYKSLSFTDMGSRNTFEFLSRVNLSGRSLYCT